MFSIDPVINSRDNDPSVLKGTPGPTGIHAPVGTDTLGTFETYLTFLKFVLGAQTLLSQNAYDIAHSDISQLAKLQRLLYERSLFLLQSEAAIRQLAIRIQTVADAQAQLQQAIDTFNAQAATQRDILNAAITAYNNGGSQAALGIAILIYTQNMQGPVAAYLQAVQNYKYADLQSEVNDINSQLAQYGIPTISLSAPPTINLPITQQDLANLGISGFLPRPQPHLNSTNFPLLASISVTIALTPDEAVRRYATNVMTTTDATAAQTKAAIASVTAAIFSQPVFTPGGSAQGPTPQEAGDFLVSSTGGTAGPGAETLSTSMSSPFLEEVLSNARYAKLLSQNDLPLSPQEVDQLRKLTFLLFYLATATAGADEILHRLVANAGDQDRDNVTTVAAAFAFSNAILGLIDSNVIDGVVAKVIRDANAPLSDQQTLIKQATAAVKLNLLHLSSEQLAQAAGLPGLPAQIAGNIHGAPGAGTLFSDSEAGALMPHLQDPRTLDALKSELSSSGSEGTVQKGVHNTVEEALRERDSLSFEGLHAAFARHFQGAGLPQSTAQTLSDRALKFLKNEAAVPNLNAPFISTLPTSAFPALAQSVRTTTRGRGVSLSGISSLIPDFDRHFPEGSTNRSNLQNLLAEANRHPEFLDALQTTLASPQQSTRGFRSTLIENLTKAGFNPANAEHLGNVASKALSVNSLTPEETANPLHSSGAPRSVLKPSALVDALDGTLANKLRSQSLVSESEQQLQRLVIKQLTAYNEQIRIIRDEGNKHYLNDFLTRAAVNKAVTVPKLAINKSIVESVLRAAKAYQDPVVRDSLMLNNPFREPIGWEKHDIIV